MNRKKVSGASSAPQAMIPEELQVETVLSFVRNKVLQNGRMSLQKITGHLSSLVQEFGSDMLQYTKVNKLRRLINSYPDIFELKSDIISVKKTEINATAEFLSKSEAPGLKPVPLEKFLKVGIPEQVPIRQCPTPEFNYKYIEGQGKIANIFKGIGFISRECAQSDKDNVHFGSTSVRLLSGKKCENLTDIFKIGEVVYYRAQPFAHESPTSWKAVDVWKNDWYHQVKRNRSTSDGGKMSVTDSSVRNCSRSSSISEAFDDSTSCVPQMQIAMSNQLKVTSASPNELYKPGSCITLNVSSEPPPISVSASPINRLLTSQSGSPGANDNSQPRYAILNEGGRIQTILPKRGVIVTLCTSKHPNRQIFFTSNVVIWEGAPFVGDLCDILVPGALVNFDAKFLRPTSILIADCVWRGSKPNKNLRHRTDVDLGNRDVTASLVNSKGEKINIVVPAKEEKLKEKEIEKSSRKESALAVIPVNGKCNLLPKQNEMTLLLEALEDGNVKSLKQLNKILLDPPEREKMMRFVSLLFPHCSRDIGIAALFNHGTTDAPNDPEEKIAYLNNNKGRKKKDRKKREKVQAKVETQLALRKVTSEDSIERFPGERLKKELVTDFLERLDIVYLLKVLPDALKRRVSNLNYPELQELHDCLWENICTISHIMSEQEGASHANLWDAPEI